MVVVVNTTGEWGSYSIVKIILIGFSTDFMFVNFCAGPRRFFILIVMRKRNCHVNTGL